MLSKLASTQKSGFNRKHSIGQPLRKWKFFCLASTTMWMDPIVDYLWKDEVSAYPQKAKKLRREASKWLDLEEARYSMKEVHEGVCGTHIGGRALTSKIASAGYYWLTLKKVAQNL
ncbi:hypothetical protein CR513_44888, partial [Mucuna pruriens]